jgi:hypothetical protein
VPTLLQLTSQFLKVIKLSIENHPDRIVLIGHELLSGLREGYDLRAPMTEENRWPSARHFRYSDELAIAIRAEVPEHIHHPPTHCIVH